MPDFFIVGAPKCGTTAMYEYLRQHPGLFMPFHKEPLYFGSDLHHRYGRLTEAEYLALFRPARPDQLAGEASAWYLYSTTAAAEIKAASPEARIIVMLRNPVDVMYAQHSQLLFNRQEDINDFGLALAAEEERMAGRSLPGRPIRPENLFYRRMVQFSEQLARYFAVFGRDGVHVIVHDDLLADTPEVYRSTLEFLGVDATFSPTFERANEHKRVRSPLLQRLAYDPPVVRRLAPMLRRHPAMHAVRNRLVAANSTRIARPAMDPAL
ncbi:MAG TPA: sulfotransferase, partial [Candidatus Limnocylindrales bacterium]|nr:sulfotransferase [Candidatus Limnocylindrales bacterium]